MQWTTIISHPASGTRYQENEAGTVARLVVDGRVLVRPRVDTELVYRAYQRRVAAEIASYESEEK
jgi:hypothetical protein